MEDSWKSNRHKICNFLTNQVTDVWQHKLGQEAVSPALTILFQEKFLSGVAPEIISIRIKRKNNCNLEKLMQLLYQMVKACDSIENNAARWLQGGEELKVSKKNKTNIIKNRNYL